jgi:hypothetical protein
MFGFQGFTHSTRIHQKDLNNLQIYSVVKQQIKWCIKIEIWRISL